MSECVTVYLATFNGEKYIEQQIRSIQSQSLEQWKLVVSDDGSSDTTTSILAGLAREDDRITVVQNKKGTGSACRNFIKMMRDASAGYFALCDQDDIWLPGKLEVELSRMRALEEDCGIHRPCLVYSDSRIVDENLTTIADSFLEYSGKSKSGDKINQLLMTNVVQGSTILGNGALLSLLQQSFDGVGGYVPLMHDWWIALIATSCGQMERVPEALLLYRQHGNNVVGAESGSLLRGRLDLTKSYKMFWDCVDQAKHLRDALGREMHEDAYKVVDSFARIPDYSRMNRLLHVYKHGLLKNNPIKALSEMLILATSSPEGF